MENRRHPMMELIYRYEVRRDGKPIETNIIGWKTALAHARIWSTDLFDNPRKTEIVNLYTGEIFSLEEAEKRAANYARRQRVAVNSGYHIK